MASTWDWRNLWLLLCVIIGFFLLCELGVRTYDAVVLHQGFFSDFRNLLKKNERRTLTFPFRTFGFDMYEEEPDGKLSILSSHHEKYPLEKGPDTFRIVCFGGSTTQNRELHYPKVLEGMLQAAHPGKKIEVINVGLQSYATPHMIILLALDVLSWKPDLVIASEDINDVEAAYYPHFRFDLSNKFGTPRYSPNVGTQYSFLNAAFQWSHFYWLMHRRISLFLQERELRHFAENRKNYGDELPQVNKDVFARNWRTFIGIARTQNIQVILGTQPFYPESDFYGFLIEGTPINGPSAYPPKAEFAKHHAQFNDIIRASAKDNNVLLVDNAMIFGGKAQYFTDIVHYTDEGVRLLAKDYFDAIEGNHLIP